MAAGKITRRLIAWSVSLNAMLKASANKSALHRAASLGSRFWRTFDGFEARSTCVVSTVQLIDSTTCEPLFVLELRMKKKRRKTITEKQWQDAVEAYELGTHNGVQIARQLGVSASAVSRQFKRRDARKGCRAAEMVAELEAELAAKARHRARHRSLKEAAAMERLALINAMMKDMVATVLAAIESGDVPTAATKVAEVRQALKG